MHEIDSSITGSITPGGIGKTPLSVTPNNMIATPFRTPAGSEFSSGMTPRTPGSMSQMGGQQLTTPLRDKLAINPEEGFYLKINSYGFYY